MNTFQSKGSQEQQDEKPKLSKKISQHSGQCSSSSCSSSSKKRTTCSSDGNLLSIRRNSGRSHSSTSSPISPEVIVIEDDSEEQKSQKLDASQTKEIVYSEKRIKLNTGSVILLSDSSFEPDTPPSPLPSIVSSKKQSKASETPPQISLFSFQTNDNIVKFSNDNSEPIDLNTVNQTNPPNQKSLLSFWLSQSSSTLEEIIQKTKRRKLNKSEPSRDSKQLLHILDKVEEVVTQSISLNQSPLTSSPLSNAPINEYSNFLHIDSPTLQTQLSITNLNSSPLVPNATILNSVNNLTHNIISSNNIIPSNFNILADKEISHQQKEVQSTLISQSGKFHRFLVLEVSSPRKQNRQQLVQHKKLKLFDETNNNEKFVTLADDWYFVKVKPGDIVNVIGQFDSFSHCTIDNQGNNFLIVHPDLLITGTVVGESFGCKRQSILKTISKVLNFNHYPSLNEIFKKN